jgi:hypothetical protein
MGKTTIGVTPINSGVFVDLYDDGAMPLQFASGGKLLMISDADLNSVHNQGGMAKHKGIRPRWGIVTGLSDEAIEQTSLKIGDKVLMEFGKWTPGFTYDETRKKAWWIKHTDIIMVDEDGPTKQERAYIKARNKGSV